MSLVSKRHLELWGLSQNRPRDIFPKNGLIALWPSTNGAILYFLVLLGSELSITEITEYTYFSP